MSKLCISGADGYNSYQIWLYINIIILYIANNQNIIKYYLKYFITITSTSVSPWLQN